MRGSLESRKEKKAPTHRATIYSNSLVKNRKSVYGHQRLFVGDDWEKIYTESTIRHITDKYSIRGSGLGKSFDRTL